MSAASLLAALRASLPGLVVLTFLAMLNQLSWGAALGGYLAILAGSRLAVDRHMAALGALRSFIDRKARDELAFETPSILTDAPAPVQGLVSALVRLDKAHCERQQEALRLAELRGGVLDSVPDPLATLDDQLCIVWANQPARTLLGQTIVGREISTVLRDPSVLQAVKAALSLKTDTVRTLELRLSDPIERDFMFGVQRLAHRAPDGTCAVLILHDVTALRRAERIRADFIANASHELRTPLASLVGFIETLQGPARDDQKARARFLVIMHEQAQRMTRLVEDLLSLSRIEQREYQTPTDLVDLVPLIEQAIAGLELQARGRDMPLILTASFASLAVRGAADDLTQLIQNLIDNALKYGKSGEPVEIALALASSVPPSLPKSAYGAVALSVSDRGEGIAREHLSRLTERFYRIDKARSRAIGGTGLGLAICKHIVNRHRGALTIESELGRGTKVSVFLPLPAPSGGSKNAQ